MTADINADRKERRRLQCVRHAAREVAANIVYQSIVRDPVKEAYLENLNKYENRADSATIWFCGLLGRECCDVFRRLSDMHVALLRDVIKNGGGAEYI
ncbi:MAG: hypothetical protein ILO36_00680, partial [Abditibacteriota bacterium]|nr:hypothetical protein [Abditibacteriota bacterium]